MVKKTEGIILYVKIDKVRDEEDSLGYIRSHFQEYVNDFENCIDSAVTSKYVSNSNLSILKNCDYELQEALSCLNTLKNTLQLACNEYEESNKATLSTYNMGNLYAHTPFYKTTTFKIVVGVVVVAAVLVTIICVPELLGIEAGTIAAGLSETLGVEISVELLGEVVGAKAMAVTVTCVLMDSLISGAISAFEGGSFVDEFADTLFDDAITGIITFPVAFGGGILFKATGSVLAKLYIGLVVMANAWAVNEAWYSFKTSKTGYHDVDDQQREEEYINGVIGESILIGKYAEELNVLASNTRKTKKALELKTEEIYSAPGYVSKTARGRNQRSGKCEQTDKNKSENKAVNSTINDLSILNNNVDIDDSIFQTDTNRDPESDLLESLTKNQNVKNMYDEMQKEKFKGDVRKREQMKEFGMILY